LAATSCSASASCSSTAHLQEQTRLFDLVPGVFPAFHHLLGGAQLFLHFLGTIGVVPEIRGQDLAFEDGYLLFLGIQVKDAP
jgi:hypothetical protein